VIYSQRYAKKATIKQELKNDKRMKIFFFTIMISHWNDALAKEQAIVPSREDADDINSRVTEWPNPLAVHENISIYFDCRPATSVTRM
jgi:hypothetical protein